MVRILILFVVVLAIPEEVWAGMPSARGMLREVTELRLQNMSFFLMGFFLSALGVQKLWNYLQADWPVLPRLTYGKALGLVLLWALLFILILTMISGARELMTPGAWQHDGIAYKLNDTR